jgi:hypothetical protein
MDQLFEKLAAFSDDQEIFSKFHHAVLFASYSVGHRMSRFVDESEDNLQNLKDIQGEISRVNSELKSLRTSRLRECGGLDPLALLLFMEEKVFCHFPGYKSALDKVTKKR